MATYGIVLPRPARGPRPIGPVVRNMLSPQNHGLTGWFVGDGAAKGDPGWGNLAGGVSADMHSGTFTVGGGSIGGLVTTASAAAWRILSTLGLSHVDNSSMTAWAYLSGNMQGAAAATTDDSGGGGYSLGIGSGTLDSAGTEVVALFSAVRWVPTGVSYGNEGWHLLGLSKVSGGVRIYLDGRFIYSDASGDANSFTRCCLCNEQTAGSRHLSAQYADTRFYSRTLSDADHWALYDPATRWDLYWVPGRRVFFDVGAAAANAHDIFRSPVFRPRIFRGAA